MAWGSGTDELQARQCRHGKALVVKALVAVSIGHAGGFDVLEVVPAVVHQVRGHHVVQRGEHALDAARVLLFPVAQHVANLLALQVLLAAAQGTGDDGKLTVRGPARQVFLSHVGQRPDHDVAAIVADQLGRHTLELAAKEHVQEKSLQHVVTVVAQRDLGHLELVGHPVQDAAAQPAAQAAHGLALGDHLFDNAVSVLRLDVKRHAELLQVGRQDVIRKARLLLVQVDRNQLKVDWRPRLELEQNVQHAVAVFSIYPIKKLLHSE